MKQEAPKIKKIEPTLVFLSILNYSNTASIPSFSDPDNILDVKLDEINNFVALKVQLNGIISLDQRIWVADSTPIICIDVWNTLLAKLDGSNLAKLKLGFITRDGMATKTPFGVIK